MVFRVQTGIGGTVMNPVTFVLGVVMTGAAFVMFIRRLHDRSMHDAVAIMRATKRDRGQAVVGFASLLAPAVSALAVGLAFVAIGVAGRAPALSWFGW